MICIFRKEIVLTYDYRQAEELSERFGSGT